MKRGLFGSYPRMHRLDRTVYSRRARGVFAGSEDPERGVEGIADFGRIHGAVIGGV